jgi:hypothetical protein
LTIIMAATPNGMDVVGLDNGAHGQSCAQRFCVRPFCFS